MSFKLIILMVVALVGFQAATGFYLDDIEHLDDRAVGPLGEHSTSLLEPSNAPVTFIGQLMHLRPVKYLIRILFFPLISFLRIMRIVLSPVRFLLLPIHALYYAFQILTAPFTYVSRFVLNLLLLLPIINIPVRAIVAIFRLFSFPSAAIASTIKYLLGPTWGGYIREYVDLL